MADTQSQLHPEVLILMGSASDWKYVKGVVDVLRGLAVSFEVHVSSAHRTPERTAGLVRSAETGGCRVFICAAGMAAHLAGAVAANTVRPVLGVPLPGGVLDGVDALLSTVQIVAGSRPEVAQALAEARRQGGEKVEEADREIAAEIDGGSG
jgi:5-(carboxyamino)imidazole ribonucleotide mutase